MITPELASVFQEGLDLHIGTRDAHLRPGGSRAVALQVEPDGRHVVVHVPARAAARLLPDLESNGHAAICVGRPEDERAWQLKGVVVAIRTSTDDEKPIVDAQFANYVRQMEIVGIPEALTSAWSIWPAVAVRLKVTALFEQTPAPGTGYALS